MRLVKAREVQLTEKCFQSLENMEKYSEETVSPIIYMSLEVAGNYIFKILFTFFFYRLHLVI